MATDTANTTSTTSTINDDEMTHPSVGTIPAFLMNAAPITVTSPGSGLQKYGYQGPTVTAKKPASYDPLTGALLGAAAGYMMNPQSTGNQAITSGLKTVIDKISGKAGSTTGGTGSLGITLPSGTSSGSVITSGGTYNLPASGSTDPTTFKDSGGNTWSWQNDPTHPEGGTWVLAGSAPAQTQSYADWLKSLEDSQGSFSSQSDQTDSNVGSGGSGFPVNNNYDYNYLNDYTYDVPMYGDYSTSYNPNTDTGSWYDFPVYKQGGLATPLMASGGPVQHFADAGAATSSTNWTSSIADILGSGTAKGAALGALFTNLLNEQAARQGEGVNTGVDMSKVGVIAPRTTTTGPTKFVPYAQYGSQTPMTNLFNQKAVQNLATLHQSPLAGARTGNTLLGLQNYKASRPLMADGGAVAPYYTYGTAIDPMQKLSGMSHGGSPHESNQPTVEGRIDYRQGSRVSGPGDGQSDDIPAMLADGEYVFDADTVAQLGNGSTKAGSEVLDKFREEIRSHKRSAPTHKIPPPAKSPLQYLAEAQGKKRSK